MRRKADVTRAQQQIQQKRRRIEAQMATLQAELEADEIELNATAQDESEYLRRATDDRIEMERSRKS
jgi:hypothetical protein